MALIHIDALAPEQWVTWRDMRLRALADAPDAFGETLAQASQRSDAEWIEAMQPKTGEHRLIALEGAEPIGMCFVNVKGDTAWLYAMWVDPGHRGKGCGAMLLHRAIAIAREQGRRTLRLRVTSSNAAPRRLYRLKGFTETGEVTPLRPGDSVDTLTMELDLTLAGS
jgi:GNAT superfamily N-acetyltransferase